MKRWQIVAALALGFLLGGFAYLWALDEVARKAITAGGLSTFMWNGKEVSETSAVGAIFYGLFIVPLVCILAPYGVGVGLAAIRHQHSPRFGWARLDAVWTPCAAALLGALIAITLNQQTLGETYIEGATPGSYLAATIALGLPAMQAFTTSCQRALLFLLLLTLVAWIGTRWHRA